MRKLSKNSNRSHWYVQTIKIVLFVLFRYSNRIIALQNTYVTRWFHYLELWSNYTGSVHCRSLCSSIDDRLLRANLMCRRWTRRWILKTRSHRVNARRTHEERTPHGLKNGLCVVVRSPSVQDQRFSFVATRLVRWDTCAMCMHNTVRGAQHTGAGYARGATDQPYTCVSSV